LAPFGLYGGGPGALTQYVLVRDGTETILPTKHEVQLRAGDVLSVRTSGGGGIGPPTARDRELIERDVRLGYLSPEYAEQAYSVSFATPTR
jgi:N-methylhydantoinase B/oxoprolinase/acetone carboxylase alpha subunit